MRCLQYLGAVAGPQTAEARVGAVVGGELCGTTTLVSQGQPPQS